MENLLDLGMFPLLFPNWSACLRPSGEGPLSAVLAALGPRPGEGPAVLGKEGWTA